jgi:hypothetical protein
MIKKTFMQFWITVRHDFKYYNYKVKYYKLDKDFEQFTVIARNKSLLFLSNRPLLRNKGLRHKRPDIKLHDGLISNTAFLERIVEQLHQYMERAMEN